MNRLAASVRSIVWVGPSTSGLKRLVQQLQSASHVLHFRNELEQLSTDDFIDHQVDRIIVASRSRIDDPRPMVEFLASRYPEIPRAVALDNWWDGSRRTGVGDSGQLMLPWYRWWDGWVDWLAGDAVELLGPVVSASDPWFVTGPLGQLQSPPTGLIVANCWQIGESWRTAASAIGSQASTVSEHRLLTLASGDLQPAAEPAWILWDDSCLTPRSDELSSIAQFLRSTATRFPTALRCLALSLPRIEVLESLANFGPLEMIAKPNTGRGLQRWITTRCGGLPVA